VGTSGFVILPDAYVDYARLVPIMEEGDVDAGCYGCR